MSLDKNDWSKGGKRFGKKGKCVKIPLSNTKMAIIPYFSVQSGILVQLLSAS